MAKIFFETIELEAQRSMEQTEFGRDYQRWEVKSHRCFNQLSHFLTERQARQLFTMRDQFEIMEGISNTYYFRMGFYIALSFINEVNYVARETE